VAADMLFRLQPSITTTAAERLKGFDFVRAVTVDPFVVWAPEGDWGATDALVNVLSSERITSTKLAAILDRSDFCELGLLRVAVSCLGPGLERDTKLRSVLADLYTAPKDTAASYDFFVAAKYLYQPGGDDGMAPSDGAGSPIDYLTEAQMASAHPLACLTIAQYTATWMDTPESVASFKAACGITYESPEDFLLSGLRVPNFLALRPVSLFYGTAQVATDDSH